MNLYHQARIKHRQRLIRLFAGKPNRESIVREAQRDLAESLDAIAIDDGEDF